MAMYQINYFLKLLKYNLEWLRAYPARIAISISWVVFGFIPQFFFWYIIINSSTSIPYSIKEIAMYFLFSLGLFYNLSHVNRYFREIATGEVITNVIKPISLTNNYLYIFFTRIFINKLPNIIIITIVGCLLLGIKSSILAAIFFTAGLILGSLFFVVLFFTMFWFRNNWGIKHGIDLLVLFSSGTWIPLDLLPKFWAGILNNLPFKLMFYVPGKLYISQFTITWGIIFEYLFWIITLYILARILEYFGLKYYEQLGG